MTNLIIKILIWLIKQDPRQFVYQFTKEVFNLVPMAEKVCFALMDKNPSGEWKRRRAYATLLSIYPKSAHRDVSVAIEIAIRNIEDAK